MDSKEHDKKISYSELEIGTIVSKQSYLLDRESVQKYILAVEDSTNSTVAESSNIAPPMSIAALSLRGVVNDLNIPGATLHIGQELSFLKAVPVGIYLE